MQSELNHVIRHVICLCDFALLARFSELTELTLTIDTEVESEALEPKRSLDHWLDYLVEGLERCKQLKTMRLLGAPKIPSINRYHAARINEAKLKEESAERGCNVDMLVAGEEIRGDWADDVNALDMNQHPLHRIIKAVPQLEVLEIASWEEESVVNWSALVHSFSFLAHLPHLHTLNLDCCTWLPLTAWSQLTSPSITSLDLRGCAPYAENLSDISHIHIMHEQWEAMGMHWTRMADVTKEKHVINDAPASPSSSDYHPMSTAYRYTEPLSAADLYSVTPPPRLPSLLHASIDLIESNQSHVCTFDALTHPSVRFFHYGAGSILVEGIDPRAKMKAFSKLYRDKFPHYIIPSS